MKKYLSFFRLRFSMGLQYRVAAWAGIVTQYVWGGMQIMMFQAFYRTEPDAFPMTFQAAVCYVWFQQAFLALFAPWMLENEIFDSIKNGNLVYELCRPVGIYPMWFARSVSLRLSRAVLRCFPVLLLAVLLPAPYGLTAPASLQAGLLFPISLVLALLVTVAFGNIIYILTFFTISPQGLRLVMTSVQDFLVGSVIPIPFLPDRLAAVLEWTPFAAMQNVPLRVYSGDICGSRSCRCILLQLFWLLVLTALGQGLSRIAQKHIIIQGG